MEIRKILPNENLTSLKIQSIAFTINNDYNTGEDFQDDYETVRALFNDERKMCASINHIPFNIRFDGHIVKMAGIGGVASLPEERNNGYIKKLMRYSLEEMRDNDQLFSYLYPFSNPYYRQFGYECGNMMQFVKIPLTAFSAFKTSGYAKFFNYEEDLDIVKEIYNKFIEDKNLSIVREEKQWKSLFDKDTYKTLYHTYIWYNHEGKAVSYISFQATAGTENEIKVQELAWKSYEGLTGILGFMNKFKPHYTSFIGYIPEFINLQLLFPEPKQIKVEEQSSGMNRIVNVEKVLALMNYPVETGEVSIEVTDNFLEWNTGTFVITWEGDNVQVVKKEVLPDLRCSIQVLTQLVTGYESLKEIEEYGIVNIYNQAPLLYSIFTKKKLFIRDFF